MRLMMFLAVLTVVAVSSNSARAVDPLSLDQMKELRTLIKPTAGEDPFDTIPWETDLWAARKKAAAAGKPIVLWEMDGHPLGCG